MERSIGLDVHAAPAARSRLRTRRLGATPRTPRASPHCATRLAAGSPPAVAHADVGHSIVRPATGSVSPRAVVPVRSVSAALQSETQCRPRSG
jgi:hypothetical protein